MAICHILSRIFPARVALGSGGRMAQIILFIPSAEEKIISRRCPSDLCYLYPSHSTHPQTCLVFTQLKQSPSILLYFQLVHSCDFSRPVTWNTNSNRPVRSLSWLFQLELSYVHILILVYSSRKQILNNNSWHYKLSNGKEIIFDTQCQRPVSTVSIDCMDMRFYCTKIDPKPKVDLPNNYSDMRKCGKYDI